MLKYLRKHQALLPAGIAALVLMVLVVGGLMFTRTSGYAVYINDQKAFVVKDDTMVKQVARQIQAQEEKRYHQKLIAASELECRRTLVQKGALLSTAAMKKELNRKIEFKASAGAIIVNGKTVAYVESPAAAQGLLANLKKEYSQVESGEKLLKLAFVEKVKVESRQVAVKQLVPVEKAYQLITTGSKNPEKYIVKEGDSIWMIARKNDMYVDDIVKANHLTSDKLSLDQKLILVKSKPYINVVARVQGEKTEEIAYETKVVTDKKSPSRVSIKQEGKNGQKHIVYVASKRNGVVDKREIVEEKIIQAAVDRIIIQGSGVTQIASRGLVSGSGALSWPLYGVVTQYFSGGHTGIDVGVDTGTAIHAADRGYVYFAGYSGGYGLCVKIDHGNGIETNYAHCSSLKVSQGQQVSKGQLIALSGSTGRSTGPHLHFEVMKNGAFTNPLSYLR